MKIESIIEIIEDIAPLTLGADWDNSGIQINIGNDEITNILICLDINDGVINEAIDNNVDLIVSHHPLLFNRPKTINIDDVTGKYVIDLIKSGISVYSSHIPFDNADNGNNFYLAEILGLINVNRLKGDHPGVVGEFPMEMDLNESIEEICDILNINRSQLDIVGDLGMNISKVAICTGSGFDIIDEAINMECQLVISGEMKLHQAQYGKAKGISLIDAGHYHTEKIFVENLAHQLKVRLDESVNIIESQFDSNPFLI
ncbi:MAG: Nif3-like dinuclear metal center hexameric protein [Anaerovoracaceae bacterium]